MLGILAGGAFAAWKWWDKQANPDWGCQKISDMLLRGPALPELDVAHSQRDRSDSQPDRQKFGEKYGATQDDVDKVIAYVKDFGIKPIPDEELRREIDLFCELFTRPDVMAALKKFLEDSGPMPYLP